MVPNTDNVRGTGAILCVIFFVSGASALIFETIWFQLAGITFGNSVWAGSIVLTSFMGGLALGNALAARYGRRIARPLVAYARIEILIAVTGVLLILALPRLSGWLAPLFRPIVESPWLINPLRLFIAFALMLVPTTAMGMTLPLLVKVLFRSDPSFGKILGRLYGWNTLGAVAGALAGEVALFAWLGLRGAGYVAAGFNLFAAVVALALARRLEPASHVESSPVRPTRLSSRARLLLLGGFLAGGILLAFEVVWFRFLQLFVVGTTFAFAFMLATVLAGIGLGGIVASWWLRIHAGAHRFLVAVSLAAGAAALVSYAVFAPPETTIVGRAAETAGIVRIFLSLMFPVSVLSGILFTLFGEAAQKEIGQETRTAGLLTLANTLGAMGGALVGGFVLLPSLGLERSFFVLGAAYALVALCALEPRQRRLPVLVPNGLLAAGLALLLALFPFGSMRGFLDEASDFYRQRYRSRTVAVREGLTETIQYLQRDFEGRPLNHRLMTNGYSMSGTSLDSKRYMKFFIYLPVALHPETKRALLIGYGAGSTAKAMTDTASLERIDVVDISRDILDLSPVVYPAGTDPLDDPRLATHIEDGRYFLQTTEERYDLITAEPPPPIASGAVNLYSEEYFELIHERLADGGLVTYWLPVRQMSVPTARSILAAFCNVFDDCSLWSGCQLDWMMVGSRGAAGPVPEERFGAQWRDPVVGPEMRSLGFELPEQLGAAFIADTGQLREMIDGAAPVTDDRPKRLSLERAGPEDLRQYREWTEPPLTRRRFNDSATRRELWPEPLGQRTQEFFEYQRLANMQVFGNDPDALSLIDRLLERPGLRTMALWLMNHSVDQERIVAARVAEGATGLERYLGASALADRQYDLAADWLARDTKSSPRITEPLRVLALCKAGRTEQARVVAGRYAAAFGDPPNHRCW